MKYLILGAGPSGLTFANKLLQAGEKNFLVLEKEAVAGGLCRSMLVDGAPLDIGGGHFLDVRDSEVTEFLFKFISKRKWKRYKRNSTIRIKDTEINHPFEANIWQLPIKEQVDYLISIAEAGCNTGKKEPEKFIDWIYWKLGTKITEEYMLPYNKKMFGDNLNTLGTYWLEKLPSVSFRETLMSCLQKKMYGTQPGHSEFFYPKQGGYGILWTSMADKIKEHIVYNSKAEKIDFSNRTVIANNTAYTADNIISTIPWTEFESICGMPNDVQKEIEECKYTSVDIEYFPQTQKTQAHWIYIPDIDIPYHRILVRHNFCPNSRGYWTETNATRSTSNKTSNFIYTNQYAYPLNTIKKTTAINKIISWSKTKNVYGLGRWGEWQHYNSDVVVKKAFDLFNILVK